MGGARPGGTHVGLKAGGSESEAARINVSLATGATVITTTMGSTAGISQSGREGASVGPASEVGTGADVIGHGQLEEESSVPRAL